MGSDSWSAMKIASGSWSAMTTAGEQHKPLTNQGTTLQKTVCVRRSGGETDALAKQRRRGMNTAQVRSLSEREQMDDPDEKKLKERTLQLVEERTYSW